MNLELLFEIFSWVAIITFAVAYWLQVLKIYKHKEVRDLSLVSYSVLSAAYFLFSIEALYDWNPVLLGKAIVALIPCLVIIMLIIHNKHCEWVDDDSIKCSHCGKALQPYHLFCSSCGKQVGRS